MTRTKVAEAQAVPGETARTTVGESPPPGGVPGRSTASSPGAAPGDEELRLSRSLIAAMPVAVVSTDEHGLVVQANPAAASLLGATVSALDHAPVFLSLDEASRREGRSLLERAIRTRHDVHGRLMLSAPARGVECQVTLVPAVPADDGPAVAHERPAVDVVRWFVVPTDGAPAGAGDIGSTATDPALEELCRLGIGEADLRALLARVTKLACGSLPTVVAASIVVGDPGEPSLLASSCTVAQAGDAVQTYAGEGPVFDAYRHARPASTDDLFGDSRWCLKAVNGSTSAARACLALPFALGERVVGVLTLYGPGPLAADTLASRARPYLTTAAALVRDARLLDDIVAIRDQLLQALTSRSQIDQAKGIIMAIHGCDADEAFALLVRTSNTTHRKVREIAADVITQAVGDGASLPPLSAPSRHSRRGGRERRPDRDEP